MGNPTKPILLITVFARLSTILFYFIFWKIGGRIGEEGYFGIFWKIGGKIEEEGYFGIFWKVKIFLKDKW
jgi:hypothetical protein